MGRFVAIVALAAISAGCLGASSSAPPPPNGYRLCTRHELQTKLFKSACAYRTPTGAWKTAQVSPTSGLGVQVRWTVVYPVGTYARTRAGAPPCPTGATCRVLRNRNVTYGNGRHAWTTLATRTLTCPEGRGDYPDPRHACQALTRLRAILRITPKIVCYCPATMWPVGKATATIKGTRVTVPFDSCTYCGRSTHTTTADLLYLQLQQRS
jgi:hypothetical protein